MQLKPDLLYGFIPSLLIDPSSKNTIDSIFLIIDKNRNNLIVTSVFLNLLQIFLDNF